MDSPNGLVDGLILASGSPSTRPPGQLEESPHSVAGAQEMALQTASRCLKFIAKVGFFGPKNEASCKQERPDRRFPSSFQGGHSLVFGGGGVNNLKGDEGD